MNPRAFRKKYSDHAGVILSWRNMRLEEGKSWDPARRLYVLPSRATNGALAPADARITQGFALAQKFFVRGITMSGLKG